VTEGSTRRRTYHIKWGTIPSLPHVDEDLGIDGPSLGRHDCRRQLYVPVLRLTFSGENQKRMRFLFTCGMSTRVEALAFKVWRDHITTMIQTACFAYLFLWCILLVITIIMTQLGHFWVKTTFKVTIDRRCT
jgi:hypothetical protein